MGSTIEIWYDKPNETDEDFSWVNLSTELQGCSQNAIDYAPYPKVLALMEYARPDVVISIDGEPFLALETTQMNPSGHNLPQRFSCLVRAAELGVPSIYYYLEKARRSDSDPKPRYANIRVPLGQRILSEVYNTPSISVIWPTDKDTLQAEAGLDAHRELASIVDEACILAKQGKLLENNSAIVIQQFQIMQNIIDRYHSSKYTKNSSYNALIQPQDCLSMQYSGRSIVPPESCVLQSTRDFLNQTYLSFGKRVTKNKKVDQLLSRDNTLVYSGTANKQKDGPEHPYPGYITLIDILYTRAGMTTRERKFNLAFSLPIDLNTFKDKAIDRPVGLNILMEFCDLIILNDALIVGGWLRNLSAGSVLVKSK